MKLGQRATVAGYPYEVTSVYSDGSVRMRPLPKNAKNNGGGVFREGDVCRIVNVDHTGDLAGEIISLVPFRARVTTKGAFFGYELTSQSKVRKA